ncbi:exocyst complex component 3-like [Planococcus citri]|uniref:exocyst complex component 3-like n=1 Tax=Planococcus citri TaxID=170843 RepID=UPI0031FA1C19
METLDKDVSEKTLPKQNAFIQSTGMSEKMEQLKHRSTSNAGRMDMDWPKKSTEPASMKRIVHLLKKSELSKVDPLSSNGTQKQSMEDMKREAETAAMKRTANMFQKTGHLEKVEQHKRRITRKFTSTEAMLKTTMQAQLDNVTVAINQLQSFLLCVAQVRTFIRFIQEELSELSKLGNALQEVKNKNIHHSQYVTAIENLKHLFTVPESVEKTKQWISDGKLLHAHQCLIDLENSRDDLLYELHKLPDQSVADKMLLKAYFEDVEALSSLLEKQLKLVLGRTLTIVRKEPTVIVTGLRIIEREEKSDAVALQRQRQSGFLPPGRPKKWREMAFKELEKSVSQRIEGIQVDERSGNKMWLVTYLELSRQFVLEDLRVVKTLCGPCFPPSYDIINKFVHMYHQSLSTHLEEIISNGLEGNEYVSILSWIKNTYFGPELMKHPDLNIDISSVGPLLKSHVVNKLQQNYLDGMEMNYKEWMQKTLETEKQDWNSEIHPEESPDGCYQTATPVIIFQMIDQNLQVAKTIGPDLVQKALVLGMDQVNYFGKLYGEAFVELKKKHFEDRSLIPYFTHHMITITNNCLQFQQLAEEMRKHYWNLDGHVLAIPNYDSLLQTFQNLRNEAALYLLEEAFLDIDSHFQDLITTKWVSTSIPIDTICVTLEDYFQDYIHLKGKNLEYIIFEAEDLVAKRYIFAMLQKKITFRSLEERRQAASKIVREVEQLRAFFVKIAPDVTTRVNSPLDAITALAEVLKSEDLDILSLDLHTLVDKFPDITEDHLSRLLMLRGDMSRSEIREKVTFLRQSTSNRAKVAQQRSIFLQIL